MFVGRKIFYLLTVFLILTVTSNAQSAWLQRSWRGRAYILGNNPQNYDILLMINKVKGKDFEGVMQTFQPADPSVHFDTKVSGIVYDKYLLINIGTWKVKCATCKPQSLAFSIEGKKLFLKGEAKGCSQECTWITVFSIDMDEFDLSLQQSLYASIDKVETPEPDTATVAQNTKPLPDTIATPQQEKSLTTERIPVLPAGNIVSLNQNNALPLLQNPPVLLHKTLSMIIPQNEPAPQRVAVLPAGIIVLSERNNALSVLQKLPASLNKNPSLKMQENIQEPQRIAVLPAGTIVSSEHNSAPLITQTPPASLNKTPVMTINVNIPQHKIPSSVDTIAVSGGKDSSVAKKSNPALKKSSPALIRDTVSFLPAGYAERKKNVVRTLIVNTDSIVLRVYDNGVVDGDIVSVVYNDRVVVDKLSLTSRALVITIPVNKSGINTLVFHAHNLGEFPPNTAKLEILYGNKKEELTVSSDLTVSSTIDIEYQQ